MLFALDAIQDPVSLQEPIYSDGGDAVYMMDQLRDDDVSEDQWVAYVSVKESLQKLDERQQMIVAKRFYYGETQTEIAKELGISQAQISRLEKMRLKQCKKITNKKCASDYSVRIFSSFNEQLIHKYKEIATF